MIGTATVGARSAAILVTIEAGSKKTFASAADWPGWARAGRNESLALELLAATAPRYATIAAEAGVDLPAAEGAAAFDVVERVPGSATTDFGAPGRPTDRDRRPTSVADAERITGLVVAAWTVLDRVAGRAPSELRKGPRGGGRDTAEIVRHVIEAEVAYGREIGIRLGAPPLGGAGGGAAATDLRAAILEVLGRPSDGSPLAGRRWPPRYAAHRIAWHVIDHAWEIEDRSPPTG